MKKYFYILFIFVIFVNIQGCGKVQFSEKEVRIELGDFASENISDYICVNSRYKKKLEKEALLDLSDIETSTVGTYQAVITYKEQRIVVPVIVEDTTPPVIEPLKISFWEGEEVTAKDLVEAEDFSPVSLQIISNLSGKELDFVKLYPGQNITVRAIDSYHNESRLEFVPDVIMNKEEIGVPINRVYNDESDFPHEEMEFVSDEVYEEIKRLYKDIGWQSEFLEGNPDEFDLYKEKFKEFLLLERNFLNSETGEILSLEDFPPIKVPDGISCTYDMESYKYYFFDMDGDGGWELCIPETGFLAIFKYDKYNDRIILWKEINSADMHLSGSQRIIWTDGRENHFRKLDETGEMEYEVGFRWRSFESGMVYFVGTPRYAEESKNVEATEDMKNQCYYNRWTKVYYFRVSEEQYEELTGEFMQAYEYAVENIEKVTYTYDEMVN